MSKPSLVIVLLEDAHQKMLIYRYLIRSGRKRHEIRIHQSPPGQGSAQSWVQKRFVQETIVYRSRQARARTALIVIIDADNHTVRDRRNQLDEALGVSGNQGIDEDDEIARLVPRRNIETWILCLSGQVVDEETDYKTKRYNWSELILTGSEMLHQWIRLQAEPPNHCVDSLRIGLKELNRLTF